MKKSLYRNVLWTSVNFVLFITSIFTKSLKFFILISGCLSLAGSFYDQGNILPSRYWETHLSAKCCIESNQMSTTKDSRCWFHAAHNPIISFPLLNIFSLKPSFDVTLDIHRHFIKQSLLVLRSHDCRMFWSFEGFNEAPPPPSPNYYPAPPPPSIPGRTF